MADKIKCSECDYCKFYHSRYGNRKSCFCEHPDQEFIMQYFSDRDIRSMPGFIGYTGWNDSIVPCKYTPRWCPGRKAVSDMALAIVLVICATVIVVTYMLCRVREREQDLEDVYEDISLLRVSVDRFNSIEEVNASNLSCLSDHLKHVDEEIDEIQNELCNRL